MPTQPVINFDLVLNDARSARFRIGVLILCGCVALLDGFDTQSISVAAPAIQAAWQLPPSAFGLTFGFGLFGSLLGAVAAGMIGDRIGRRRVVLAGVPTFAAMSLLTPVASDIQALELIRFLTGIGLGAALTGAISLTSEYAPAQSQAATVAMMFCGFPLGAVIAGGVSAVLVPVFGWTSVFYVGGIAPLLLWPLLVAKLPESARFLAVRGGGPQLGRLLRRMGSQAELADNTVPEPAQRRLPLVELFARNIVLGTVLLGLAFFLSLTMAYFLVSWVPTLASAAGVGTQSALLSVSALNLGGIAGVLLVGRLVDRYAPALVLAVGYVLAAVAVAAIGQVGTSGTWLLVATLLAGFFGIGTQMCTLSVAAAYYKTRMRATGVGWIQACGRLGGIVGPVVGGVLIGLGTASPTLFLLVAILCLGSSLAMAVLAWRGARLAVPEPAPQ